MWRKVLGVVFLFLGGLFALAFVGQLSDYFSLLADIIGIAMGKKDAFQVGYVIGQLLSFVVLFYIMLLLFRYGWLWIRKLPDKD